LAELRPNMSARHVAEPNIWPNSSAELRRLPNFGPSLTLTLTHTRGLILDNAESTTVKNNY